MSKYKKYNIILWMSMIAIILILLTACVNDKSVQTFKAKDINSAINKKDSNETTTNSLKKYKENKAYIGDLELPISGATGYASVNLELKASANVDSNTLNVYEAGTAFQILKEDGDWWLVKRGNSSGWIQHKYCFINLPDVIPSIIYDNTNTYYSKFASSKKDIPGVSKNALYPGKFYNDRLNREQYIMPVLYSMSKKIGNAQKQALSDGNSLKLYEGYRPYTVQKKVVESLTKLANNDPGVMQAINTQPWGMSWFITDRVSNHQMGYAIDVSLVKVKSMQEISIGTYTGLMITNYSEYIMPTEIHELSGAAAVFTTAVNSQNDIDWRSATYLPAMNEAAIKLQNYCTNAGLTPLASEWWHFNDLAAKNATRTNTSNGQYTLTEIYSSSPNN
ncbi:hypothetical protein ACIQXX_25870 [Bacillus cereus]|uniref:hypothetical protein n=1 Tax=Bacillus cereus TaxID=1396 RepID=UPI0037F8C3F0